MRAVRRHPAGPERSEDPHRPLRGRRPAPLDAGDELHIAVGDFVGGPGRVSTTYADLPKVGPPGRHAAARRRANPAARGGERRRGAAHHGHRRRHARRAQGHQRARRELPSAGLTAKDAEDLQFGVSSGGGFHGAQLRPDRRRPAAGARCATPGGRPMCPSLPSSNARKPSRESTRSSTSATR